MEVDRKTLWGTLAVCVGCIGIYKLALNEDVQAAWSIRHKLWNILTSGKEDRIAYYYTELGDDIRDDFAYNSKRCREVNPDLEEPLWLNVGFWRTAKDYETAGRDMALLLAQVLLLSCPFVNLSDCWLVEGTQGVRCRLRFCRTGYIVGFEVRGVNTSSGSYTPSHRCSAKKNSVFSILSSNLQLPGPKASLHLFLVLWGML